MRATPYLLALLPAFLLCQPAQAAEKAEYYVSAGLGFSITEEADFKSPANGGVTGSFEFNDTASVSLAVGRFFSDHFRGELEFSYRDAELDQTIVNGAPLVSSGNLKSSGMMLNGYYDMLPNSLVNPYLMAGLGVVYHDIDFTEAGGSAGNDDTVFAGQIGGGLNIALTNQLLWFTDYRYFTTEDATFGTLDVEYQSHEIRTGINYLF